MSAPAFQFKPTLPKQQWRIVVVFDPKSSRLHVESTGLPNADVGRRMLEDALRLVKDKLAGVGETGLVAADGSALVKQGLPS